MTDETQNDDTQAAEDESLEAEDQAGKGYGADEGEREEALGE